jgi:hypothetical protein
VRLRPTHYLAQSPQTLAKLLRAPTASAADTPADSVIDIQTDAQGRYSFSFVDSGTYRIEIIQNDTLAAVVNCTTGVRSGTVKLDTARLAPLTVVQGKVLSSLTMPDSLVLFARGLERRASIDPTGSYQIKLPAALQHTLHLKSLKALIAPLDITIHDATPGDTLVMDSILARPLRDELVAWSHRTAVYLNTTLNGAQLQSEVDNFPVLLNLDSSSGIFDYATNDGRDVRFVSPEGALLPFEIERWSSSQKKASIWVLVKRVLRNSHELKFYCYVGNPSAPPLALSHAVFTPANGFYGVWHMNPSTPAAGMVHCSSSVVGTPPLQGTLLANAAEARAGSGLVLDGINDTLSGLVQLQTPSATYSFSLWVRTDSVPGSFSLLSGIANNKVDSPFVWYSKDTAGLSYLLFDPLWLQSRTPPSSSQMSWQPGAWYYCALSLWGANLSSTMVNTFRIDKSDYSKGREVLQQLQLTLGGGLSKGFLGGVVDELRVETIRTAEWYQLCYENQKANQSLISLGGVERLK